MRWEGYKKLYISYPPIERKTHLAVVVLAELCVLGRKAGGELALLRKPALQLEFLGGQLVNVLLKRREVLAPALRGRRAACRQPLQEARRLVVQSRTC